MFIAILGYIIYISIDFDILYTTHGHGNMFQNPAKHLRT